MGRILKIRKHGKFYNAYEDDALVLHSIMKYKVTNGKVGFPESSLGKVENSLIDAKVSYIVYNKNKEESKNEYKNNNYEYHLKEGKISNDARFKEEELIRKVENLNESQINKVIEYIERIVHER